MIYVLGGWMRFFGTSMVVSILAIILVAEIIMSLLIQPWILFIFILCNYVDLVHFAFMFYKNYKDYRYYHKSVPEFHYSLTKFIWAFVKPHLTGFIMFMVGSTIMAQHTAITSVAFGRILDKLITAASNRIPFSWSVGGSDLLQYLLIGLAMAGFYTLSGICSAVLIPKLAESVRGYFVKYILGHSYFYFSQTLGGNIVTKASYLTSGTLRIVECIVKDLIPVILFIIVTIIFTLKKHPQFRMTLLMWMGLHIALYVFRFKKYMTLSLNNASKYANLMGILSDILTNIFAIKVLYATKFEKKYFDRFQYFDISSFRKMRLYERTTSIILDIFGYSIFYSLIFMYQIINAYLNGAMTFGEAIGIYNIFRSIGGQIWNTTDTIGELVTDISRCKDALSMLAIPHGVPDSYPNINMTDGDDQNGRVEFRNIYFCYGKNERTPNQDNNYLFTNLNLKILNNSRVALVGSSGSGKSTLVNLMLRLFDPIRGIVLINGQDISKVSKASLRNTISFIPQKQFLFQRTIFENIGYGCPNIRDELLPNNPDTVLSFRDLTESSQANIVEAAQKSNCHDFIINLPKGYDSIYGTDMSLSGGQCQRLMIARAFINKATKFLVLDEATSALDAETEEFVKQSVDLLSINRTVIVVAHKLNTIKDFDRILVFDNGKIIEDGDHGTLMKQEGKYHSLFMTQMRSVGTIV